jgi:hypothetical protein
MSALIWITSEEALCRDGFLVVWPTVGGSATFAWASRACAPSSGFTETTERAAALVTLQAGDGHYQRPQLVMFFRIREQVLNMTCSRPQSHLISGPLL